MHKTRTLYCNKKSLPNLCKTFIKVYETFNKRLQNVHETSTKRSENVHQTFTKRSSNVLKTFIKRSQSKRFQTFSIETFSKRSQSKRFQNFLNQNVLKTLSKHSENFHYTLAFPLWFHPLVIPVLNGLLLLVISIELK
jgi:hypothetical protein